EAICCALHEGHTWDALQDEPEALPQTDHDGYDWSSLTFCVNLFMREVAIVCFGLSALRDASPSDVAPCN
ncbi:MAG: hypothetical protein Q8L76_05345, partial [Cypionkella sp.]|nr:hypothetical protein [Cypionkella sp.]